MLKASVACIPISALLMSCAAAPLVSGGDSVVVSQESPPESCQLLGEVQGSQGNFWTAEFTSDANLIAGARNELRNAAVEIGANYVKIETEHYSENTAPGSLGGSYAAVVIGNAYYCQNTVPLSVP